MDLFNSIHQNTQKFLLENSLKERQRLAKLRSFWISGWLGIILIILTASISIYFFINKTVFWGPFLTGASIVSTIIVFTINSHLSKRYQQWMQKALLAKYIPALVPDFDYALQKHVPENRLPDLKDEQGQPKYLLQAGSHYFKGSFGSLEFELSELEVVSDLRFKKVKIKDRFHFKGIFIRVDGLPNSLKDNFIEEYPPLAERWAKLAKYWGEAPFFQLDGEGTGYFYLPTKHTLFDTRPNQHSLRKKPYEGYIEQLEHSLGWVNQLEKTLSS